MVVVRRVNDYFYGYRQPVMKNQQKKTKCANKLKSDTNYSFLSIIGNTARHHSESTIVGYRQAINPSFIALQ